MRPSHGTTRRGTVPRVGGITGFMQVFCKECGDGINHKRRGTTLIFL